MSILQIEPLPTPEQYDRAYDELNMLGGVKESVANRALELSFNEDLIEQEKEIASYGLRFIDHTIVSSEEEAYEASYAYIHGYLSANPVLDMLYKSPHTFEDRISSVRQWLRVVDTSEAKDADEVLFKERQHLEEIGVYGLRQLGSRAMRIVHDWSIILYPEQQRHARMFCMGSGAMVASGVLHQKAINEKLAQLTVEVSGEERFQAWIDGLTDFPGVEE